jgi:hypothetical protein
VGRRLAVVVVWLAGAACRTPGRLHELPLDDPRPRLLLAAFEQAAEQRRALRGRARIEVEGGSGLRLSGRQILVAERPDRLRVEVLGLFDQALAVLTTDGDRFELFRSADLSFEEGPLRPEILWEQAHIALRPDEAIALLLGAPTPEPGLVPIRAARAEDGSVRVSLGAPGGPERRRLGFDAQGRLSLLTLLTPEGRIQWSAGFRDYALVGGVPFAHAIDLYVAAGRTRARIRLRDVELNPELPPGIFSVRPARSAAGERGHGERGAAEPGGGEPGPAAAARRAPGERRPAGAEGSA